MARTFAAAGFDVAVDDVLEPEAFNALWLPELLTCPAAWRVVIVLPPIDEVLSRSRSRPKRVAEEITRRQHVACASWAIEWRLDTTGETVEESLERARGRGLLA